MKLSTASFFFAVVLFWGSAAAFSPARISLVAVPQQHVSLNNAKANTNAQTSARTAVASSRLRTHSYDNVSEWNEEHDVRSAKSASQSPLFVSNNGVMSPNNNARRNRRRSLLLLPALLFQTMRHSLFSNAMPALAKSASVAAAAPTATTLNAMAATAASTFNTAAVSLAQSLLNLLGLPSTLSGLSALSPRAYLRPFLILFASIFTVTALRDIAGTKRRQSLDATSEWGRYADDPAARGQALMVLCFKITPYLMAAQLLKWLGGGIFSKKKGEAKVGGTRVANVTAGAVAVNGDTMVNGDTPVNGDGFVNGDAGVNGDSAVNGDNTVNGSIDQPQTAKDKDNWALRKSSSLKSKSGHVFADGLLRLGPLYIKMGQILSCRENLLPEEWLVSMEKLQDRVPAKSGQDALDLVHAAMPGGKAEFDETFIDFDDVPLAAASLGQVHRAKLRSTGEPVAIKVQRARLRDIYDKDLALMNKIATGVDKVSDLMGGKGNVGGVEQSWTQIFKDAEVILYREIDYRDEAENSARFATDFGLGLGGKAIESTALALDGKPLPSAAEWMRTPYTHKEFSTEKLLVMEFVPSIKINDYAKLAEAGVTTEDREDLAENLARAYLRQFCANKFFSTDPHPGNLGVEIVENNEEPPRLVFYDFGQACALSDDQAGGILDVIEGIADMNAEGCVKAFSRMGVLKEGADLEKVQAKVQNNFDTGKVSVKKKKAKAQEKARRRSTSNRKLRVEKAQGAMEKGENGTTVINGANGSNATVTEATPATAISNKDVPKDSEVMGDFTLPAEYAFVARAISQLDGVGKGLDPEFDFISATAPHIVEVKGAEKYLADEAKKAITGIEKKGAEIEAQILKTFGWDASVYRKKKEGLEKTGAEFEAKVLDMFGWDARSK